MARTELFSRKQPGGVFTIAGLERHPGEIFFVHSGTGANATGRGRNPDAPLATIDYAVGLCAADKGDVIYVLPGHAETAAAAGGLDLDVAGISVIGLGNGTLTPTVTLTTAATADVDVDAANILIENIHFRSGFADIAACLDVNATDCTIRNCRFTEAADDQNFLICVLGAAGAGSDRLIVEDCYAIQDDALNTHFVSLPGTSKGAVIRRNVLIGDWGTAAIGAAGNVVSISVLDNRISNAAADIDSCINIAAAGTGLVMGNLACGGAAQANGITATACALAQNFYGVVTEDLSAILDPIAT